jgi:hypothetical protein
MHFSMKIIVERKSIKYFAATAAALSTRRMCDTANIKFFIPP